MRALVLIGLALAGAAASVTSVAAEPAGDARPGHAIGSIVLEGSGEVPPQFLAKLRTEAEAALAGSDARAVAKDAVAAILASIPDLATCPSRECVARFALATAAQRVVSTRLAVTGELFDIAVELADEHGRPLRRRATRCVACTLNDAIGKTSTAIKVLLGDEHDDQVPVAIRSRPSDATVTVDGAALGSTPWSGTLVAGPHRLTVAGPRTVIRDVFVEAGTPVQLEVAVDRPRQFGALSYGLAGVGAAAVIGGVVLLTMDGDGTCSQPSCPNVYETSAPGWGLTAIGAVAIGAAGWMWWHDRHGGPTAAVVPTDDGVAALVGGRF